uniref:AlNc14C2G222 protein n=1 Tax=Albugo laibachii Nc14 TaxID=890382 RepID=F0VZN9_9STRA|nr:AlNc14C2G222 [Albugo laibachii Nc14]|eukprot:CCA14111.1 AlNc14C2G222 [Albugo laibachii Nc14]
MAALKTRSIDPSFPGLKGAPRESNRKQIYYWVRNHAYINECESSTTVSQQRRIRPSGLGTKLSPEAEQFIVQRIFNLRREGVPVASMLQLKAREIADEHAIPFRAFSGCWEWVARLPQTPCAFISCSNAH